MFDLPKNKRRRLVPLFLIPALPFLTYFFFARSENGPNHKAAAAATRSAVNVTTDVDHDGLPDVAELTSFNDRENFRRWFTWIAEMQFYNLSDQWNPEQRDCSGLVRFAWREALRPHDRQWFQRMGENYDPVAPDLAPTIGEPLRGRFFAPRLVITRREIWPRASFQSLRMRKPSRCSTRSLLVAIVTRQNLAICSSFISPGFRSSLFT